MYKFKRNKQDAPKVGLEQNLLFFITWTRKQLFNGKFAASEEKEVEQGHKEKALRTSTISTRQSNPATDTSRSTVPNKWKRSKKKFHRFPRFVQQSRNAETPQCNAHVNYQIVQQSQKAKEKIRHCLPLVEEKTKHST
jgi:hypothetical protein